MKAQRRNLAGQLKNAKVKLMDHENKKKELNDDGLAKLKDRIER